MLGSSPFGPSGQQSPMATFAWTATSWFPAASGAASCRSAWCAAGNRAGDAGRGKGCGFLGLRRCVIPKPMLPGDQGPYVTYPSTASPRRPPSGIQVRVYYKDTDFRHRLSRQDFRFIEAPTNQSLRLTGADQHSLLPRRRRRRRALPSWCVRWSRFLRPARMDDLLDVVTSPVAVKGAWITLAQEVRRRDEVLVGASARRLIGEGRTKPSRNRCGR